MLIGESRALCQT